MMAAEATNTTVIALIVTTMAGFFTMAVQQFFAARKAKRDREWDIEDRTSKQVEAALKAAADAAAIKLAIEQRAIESAAQHSDLKASLEQNIQITKLTAEEASSAKEIAQSLKKDLIKVDETAPVDGNHP